MEPRNNDRYIEYIHSYNYSTLQDLPHTRTHMSLRLCSCLPSIFRFPLTVWTIEVLSPVQTTTSSVNNATNHAEAWVRSRDRRDQSRVARPDAWSPGRAASENTSRARHTNVYKTLRAAAYVGYEVSKWQTVVPSASVLNREQTQ